MYLQHFGFGFAPFERDLPVEMLYESPRFSEAMARLIYVCEKRALSIITGEAGSGKSALLRLLSHRLDPNSYLFVYLADSQLTVRNFYYLASHSLGLNIQGQLPKLKNLFKTCVLDLFENKGKTVVIAIDEGQTLENSMLLELRFLTNYRFDSFSPLAIILAGETALKASLRTYHLSGIWRRIDVGYHLGGMDFEETKSYINHQLKNVGCNRPLFPDDVISSIQDRSKGLPAFINTFCRGCLLDAASRKQELIDGENLARVLADLT